MWPAACKTCARRGSTPEATSSSERAGVGTNFTEAAPSSSALELTDMCSAVLPTRHSRRESSKSPPGRTGCDALRCGRPSSRSGPRAKWPRAALEHACSVRSRLVSNLEWSSDCCQRLVRSIIAQLRQLTHSDIRVGVAHRSLYIADGRHLFFGVFGLRRWPLSRRV